jgi:hypothetical protein
MTPAPVLVAQASPVLFNGFYSILFPDGSHRTFRIHTKRPDAKFAPGQRILSLLVGPDRSDDWEMVAFVDYNGIHVFKRHKGSKIEKYANLIWLMAQGAEADGHELKIAKHCLRCNRLLTTPTAIDRNYGDHCWELLNGKKAWQPIGNKKS